MASLIYHTGALGDFLTAAPALRYWKDLNRGENCSLLGIPSIGDFAKQAGLIDDNFDINSTRFLPLFSEHFTPETGTILSAYTTAILFAVSGSPILHRVRQSGIRRVFWHPPFPSSRIHAVDYHLELFTDSSNVPEKDKIPFISHAARSIASAKKILAPDVSPVAIHPGSGNKKKNWPLRRFFQLADIIRKKGIPVLWLLGPAEEGLRVPPEDKAVANRQLSLCAALLRRCRAFVGNDSGMAHLAAAVGCRTLALFGPSDPVVWAPRGKDVRIIYKQQYCSPCHRSSAAPAHCDRSCMAAITVKEVAEELGDFKSPETA